MNQRNQHFKSLASVMLRITLAGGVTAAALAFAPMPRAWQASAQQLSCGITQITHLGGSFNRFNIPSISSDGTRMSFVSSDDLTGGNADLNNEIFLYDTTTDSLTQVTHTTVGFNTGPSINAAGTRIAFTSNDDLTGGNADLNDEIFLYDVTTGSFTQVSNTTAPGDSSEWSQISADGTRIAFRSNANVNGGNPDRRPEIFFYDTITDSLTQVTHTLAREYNPPKINADGTRIAFASFDLQGGIARIFLYDTTTDSITLITTAAFDPSISADGTRIAFVRFSDGQIGLYDATTGGIVQIPVTGGGIPIDEISLNAAGTRFAFKSVANLTGGNPDHEDQIFLYDVPTGSLKQITYAASYAPSISGDGTRIFFLSSADHTGSNPNLNDEVFLATCLPTTGTVPPAGVQVYPISAYTDLLSSFAYDGWFDPVSRNSVYFDAFGKLNQTLDLGLGTNVAGNVTVRGLGDGLQQVVIHLNTREGLCWGYNNSGEEEVPAFGYDPFEFGPKAVGRGTVRISQRPQPVGPIRRSWPIQSVIGNLTCDGPLRAGSGYPEGTPGFAQTTQTGLFNTGVPTGCPREHDADCFPAERVEFKPRGSQNQP